MGRGVSITPDGSAWEYSYAFEDTQAILLTTAVFHHIYYSYVSSKKIRLN